jgi:hypothetical protein
MNQGIPVERQGDNQSVSADKGDFADRTYVVAVGDKLRLRVAELGILVWA